MVYYKKSDFNLLGYKKSKTKHKMYDAILEKITTKRLHTVPFGDNRMENFRDLTGLNLYPHLIHNDPKRRRLYRLRAKHNVKTGYYNPGYFSYHILW